MIQEGKSGRGGGDWSDENRRNKKVKRGEERGRMRKQIQDGVEKTEERRRQRRGERRIMGPAGKKKKRALQSNAASY